MKQVCAHEGIKAVTSSEMEYVPEEDDWAETNLGGINAYNNTSMLEGRRTIFINTIVMKISIVKACSRP